MDASLSEFSHRRARATNISDYAYDAEGVDCGGVVWAVGQAEAGGVAGWSILSACGGRRCNLSGRGGWNNQRRRRAGEELKQKLRWEEERDGERMRMKSPSCAA